MLKRYAAVLLLILCPFLVRAAEVSDPLQQFIRDVTSATGSFTQVKLTDAGQPVDSGQSGTFSFKRPGKFKWHVLEPYEQLTLSDAQQLYQYDPDLAQVIVRDVDDSVGASPAAILFGSGELTDAFDVAARPEQDGLHWLRAQPRTPDAGFAHVDIGFRNSVPVRLLLLDSFGQITRIDLNNMQTNPVLASDEFVFTAPDDADVVKM